MQRLNNKQIVVGVAGGIAAYKAAEIVRQLRKAGSAVHVVMTSSACEFITPLTFQALSGNEVHTTLLDSKAEAGMGHIALARWADAILVSPASANFMARLASGMGDDLLSTLCLASQAPVYLAPAMNQAMWRDPATQHNCHTLAQRGITLLGPGEGEQACGDTGPGRMLEPELLVQSLAQRFERKALAGHTVVITAGPTREAIDPVRFLSNHSSGKMGFALAKAAAEAGASVTLIAGPVALPTPDRVHRVDVVDARQMYDAAMKYAADSDLFIGCAAVADYRPAEVLVNKLKKDPNDRNERLTLECVRNPDIIAAVASLQNRPFVVGFAAETDNVIGYAVNKRKKKRLDLIIANDVSGETTGFDSDDNTVTVLGPDLEESLPVTSKRQLATQLIDIIAQCYQSKKSPSSPSCSSQKDGHLACV